MLPFRSQALISLVTHTESILEKVFEYTPNQTLFHFNRTRQERKSTTLEWRRNALSGYVREPSGVLTLTVLSCSYHTVPYTAFLTDFTPMNSAIRIIPSYVKSWSTAINRRGSRIYLFKASIFKSFLFLSFLKGNTQVVPFHVWYRLDRVCPLELSRYTNNQILLHQDQHIIGKATLSSSPWHHSFPPYPQPSVALQLLTWITRVRAGACRWFTTVVCLNILSCTPLTHFTLKSLPCSDKSMGQYVCVQVI